MTKKSAGRLLKDAQEDGKKARTLAQTTELKNNKCWDELHGLYASCGSVFVQYGELGKLMQNKELMACVEDIKGLTNRTLIFTNDLQMMKGELLAIYGHHKNRHGGPVGDTDDVKAIDLMSSIEIYQHYQMWLQKHNGVCVPTLNEISAQMTQAERRYNAVINAITTETQESAEAVAAGQQTETATEQ